MNIIPAPVAVAEETPNSAPLGKSITNSLCPGKKAGMVNATTSANNILYAFFGIAVLDKSKTITIPMKHNTKILELISNRINKAAMPD
ncbi:hypothetical protein MNBD_GAMMA16-1194 [hydrothermal vent metagenome]|uniref:Uncharacterized protein n=1 Tax=hydrothermal vent metagenome TaxID=652676 RepID=A0A3B0ZMP2_9ZZZZ